MITIYSTHRYHNPRWSSISFKSAQPNVKRLRLSTTPSSTPTSDSPSNSNLGPLADLYYLHLHYQLSSRLRDLRPSFRMGYPFTQTRISGRRRVESINKTTLKLSFRPTGVDLEERNNDVDVVFGPEGGAIVMYRIREFQLDRELYESSTPLSETIPGPGDEVERTTHPNPELKSRYFTKVELQSANEDSTVHANLEYPISYTDPYCKRGVEQQMKFSFGDREDESAPWLRMDEFVAVSKEDPFLFRKRGHAGYRTPVDGGARWEASVRGHTEVGGRLEKIIHLRKTPSGFDNLMQPRTYAVIRMPCKSGVGQEPLFGLDIMGSSDKPWLIECVFAAWVIYAGLVKTS